MATTLEQKLNLILNEKQTKILPENLKKGVNYFDIEGTLESGTSGQGDIKLFETVEKMQNDTSAKEGDLAVVYREEIQNATADSHFQTATFPDTVVLDSAITDYVDIMYRATDSSAMFECWGSLNSSRFSMDCWAESGNIRIEYESSDGITYTRTDTTGNPVDFGTEIYYAYTDEWNDAIGKFIQIGGNVFEGLFTYNANYINKSRCRLFHKDDVTVSTDTDKLIRIGNNARYVDYDMLTLRNIFVQMEANGISGSNNVLYVKDGDLYVLKGATDRFNRLWLDSSTDKLTGFAPDAYGDMTSSAAYIYKLNVNDTNTPYELVETVYPTIAINNDNSNNRYSIILRDYDYCGLIFYSSENYSVSIPKTSYTIDTSLKTDSDYDASSIEHTEIPYKVEAIYLTANSQLNLTNADELLPGKTAYGKTGVIEGDGSIWDEIPTSTLARYYNFPNVYTSGSYTVYGVHNDYKYYINRAKSTVPTRQLVYLKKDNDIDISAVDAIGIDATNIEIYPREISGFSSDKSVYFNGLNVYDTATNELLKTYDGYAVIGNDRNTSRVYYYNKKSSTDVFQIYEVDLDDYENPREFYSVPYGFTKNDTYVKIKSNSTAKVQGEDTICAMHLTASSAYNGSTYDVLDVILIFNMTKGTIHQAYSRTATTNSYSAGSLDSLWTDSKVGIQLYERDGTKKRRSVLYDYATNTSTVSTDSDTVWYISGTPAGFEQDGYAYFPDKTKRYPMVTFDGEDWSNVILDENGTVLANTTSSYSVYSAGDQMIFCIDNEYYRLKSMNVDESNSTTNWIVDTSVSYYLGGAYNNANFPDCLSISVDRKYITKLYDDGSFDILSTLYGRVKLDKLILTDVDAYDICCIYISHATSNDSNISTYPTILTRYGNTISPAEYDTALDTVDEILGEEV